MKIRQSLNLKTIPNARQLGGYPAADGKQVKNNVLLRSGTLFEASREDIAALRALDLTAIIDLRTAEESAQKPNPKIEGVTNHSIQVLDEKGSNHPAIVGIYRATDTDPGRMYLEMVRAGALSSDMYSSFFDAESSMASYRKFFEILLSHEKGALLWHCTGGKDRTGLATVMILSVLGVNKSTTLKDFALTNAMNRRRIDYIVAEASRYTSDPAELEEVAALIGVSIANMELVFKKAEKESGSMLTFIQQRVGLSDAEVRQLRKKFLE